MPRVDGARMCRAALSAVMWVRRSVLGYSLDLDSCQLVARAWTDALADSLTASASMDPSASVVAAFACA